MRTAEQIDAYILRRTDEGGQPYDIADKLGISSADVRERMSALGLSVERGDHRNKYSVHPMWLTEGHELRLAIWQRQHDGARATLRGKLA